MEGARPFDITILGATGWTRNYLCAAHRPHPLPTNLRREPHRPGCGPPAKLSTPPAPRPAYTSYPASRPPPSSTAWVVARRGRLRRRRHALRRLHDRDAVGRIRRRLTYVSAIFGGAAGDSEGAGRKGGGGGGFRTPSMLGIPFVERLRKAGVRVRIYVEKARLIGDLVTMHVRCCCCCRVIGCYYSKGKSNIGELLLDFFFGTMVSVPSVLLLGMYMMITCGAPRKKISDRANFVYKEEQIPGE
ncbi:hypothetical protein F5X96DRAFT_567168 [Biscogniauxia mediterranea]|nr:hypothetical protein F5X96DRAFT_567168 [Biscogniauxia mediterranea]